MTVKYHKKNTNFQIENFLMGEAHTPDNMYFQLLELKEDRERALDNFNVNKLKTEAKVLRAIELQKGSEADKLEAEAELLEINNNLKYEKGLYDALMDELAFIERKLVEIEPLRKYKDMDLIAAHEASQSESWKLELLARSENYLLTQGSIPADHFATMRQHPEFATDIFPRIKEIQHIINTQGPEALLGVSIDKQLK